MAGGHAGVLDGAALSPLWGVPFAGLLLSIAFGIMCVVAVFLGQRPTGGYGVRVSGASVQNGVLTLTVNVTAPGEGRRPCDR